jgi:putative DNA primase/helicase
MIDIAIGLSRNQKHWKNKKTSWETFVTKVSKTHETPETYAEYINAGKERQAEIKDIGAFVGGYLPDGLRGLGKVQHRQLVTLDVDFAHVDFWDDFTTLYDVAALVYSTHKHTPEKPRLRLVFPLSRPVSSEEYQAIGRKIAEILGLQYFDGTTFQPERLMYWPSTSKDAEYYFRTQKGDFMDPDDILDLYTDWRNISEWPQCPSEKKILNQALKKQENPTEKKGLIGAFCRTYSIAEAIEKFIPDVYSPTADGRFTYSEGSTAGGAVVYDDLYIYSHHDSDPLGGSLCNAFDMVRLHKFGHMDKDPELQVTRLESYGEMMSIVSSDSYVIKELGIFNELPEGEWLGDLMVNKKGMYLQTIENILLIIQNDENLQGAFAYNQFEYRDFITKPTPWNLSGTLRYATDKDDAGLRHYLEKTYNIFQANKTRDALDIASITNGFHPVREYLNGLSWDGVSRINTVFIDALGVEDTPYARAVTRKALSAAVARVFVPGIKFDYVLTLVGSQGLGKSTVLRELGKSWYSDSLSNIQGKDAYEQIQGVWLLELGELAGLKKAEVEVIKHFITKQSDRFRVAYGRRPETFFRQCVFFGSTNKIGFLTDTTGNRRFWPLSCTKKYQHGELNINQIWAEAVQLYLKGEHLYLDEILELDATNVQHKHSEIDDRIGLVEKYLETLLPENWDLMSVFERISYLAGSASDEIDPNYEPGTVIRNKVCVAEIWREVLKGDVKDMTTNNTKFIHAIMDNVTGWERAGNKKFSIYGYQRAYTRIGTSDFNPIPDEDPVLEDHEK